MAVWARQAPPGWSDGVEDTTSTERKKAAHDERIQANPAWLGNEPASQGGEGKAVSYVPVCTCMYLCIPCVSDCV